MSQQFKKINVNTVVHNDGIDFLRGFSILIVILLHCRIHMPMPDFLPLRIKNIIFSSGHYGVCIFFVISGFLITTNCLKRWGKLQNVSILRFYQMRFARIIPCLLLLLFVLSILDLLEITGFKITTSSLPQALFSALTFHVNWLEAQTGYLPANWDVLWSLSVEEMFYIFFPLLCLLLKKPAHFIFAMLTFIAIGPFARTIFSNNAMWLDYSYLSGMDGIAFGCLAALFSHYCKITKKLFSLLLITGVFTFTLVFFFRGETAYLGLSALGLNDSFLDFGIALILIIMQEWYVNGNRKGSLSSLPLRWFGRNSYEIYLIHSFFVMIFSQFIFSNSQPLFLILIWYTIVILLSGGFGQLLAHYFSSPMNIFLREKDKKTLLAVDFSNP